MGLTEVKVLDKIKGNDGIDILKIKVFEGPDRGSEYLIYENGLTIGRDIANGLSINQDT